MTRTVLKGFIGCFAVLLAIQCAVWLLVPREEDGRDFTAEVMGLSRALAHPIEQPTFTFTRTFTPTPTRTYTPTWTFTPTKTFTPTNTYTPTPLPTPQAIYQHTDGEPSEIEPDEDIDGIAQGHTFWVYVKEVPNKPNDYTFHRKVDAGGYASISPTLNYYSNPLNGFYFSQPNNLSPGHYYYKVAVQSSYQTDEDGAEVWRGGIVVQTNTPTRTFTHTYTYTRTFTPTPLPTPQAIYQHSDEDPEEIEPENDIDGIAEGNTFWVYVKEVPNKPNDYTFHRKVDGGGYAPLSPALNYDSAPLHGFYFSQPDTLSPGHYYYKVAVQSSNQTDEDGGDVWRGGIVVQTNTPTPTKTFTPSLTFTPVPKTIHVDLDATGGNDGTSWTDAFTSIGTALDDAWIGDEIWVAEGIYSSTIALVANVSLYGGFAATETLRTERDWVQHVTTIDGNGAASTVTAADNVVLDGFTIAGGNGVTGGGISANSVDDVDIANCIVRDNTASDGGACGFYTSDATLTNCLLYSNSSTDDGGAIYLVDYCDVTLMNCTLADNSATGDTNGIYVESWGSDCVVTNSIIWDGGDELEQGNGSITVSYSCVTGGFTGTGNISTDPDFYEPESGDYHLIVGSDCIDSGTSTGPPDTDLDGGSRPQDSGYDMGAYEGGVPAPTPTPTSTSTPTVTPTFTAIAPFNTETLVEDQIDGPHSIVAADIDGDGDNDIVYAAFEGDSIGWLVNSGTGTFTANNVIDGSADGAISVCVADVDGDYDEDIVAAIMNGNKVLWYENRLDATPSTWISHTIDDATATGVEDVVALDLNFDDMPDVVAAISGENEVVWYENALDATGSFVRRLVYDGGSEVPRRVSVADFDGDEEFDVISSWGDGVQKVLVHINTGYEVFAATPTVLSSNSSHPRGVFARDLDDDGDVDAVSAAHGETTAGEGELAWYVNSAIGFEKRVISTAVDAYDVRAADIDGDGDRDLCVGAFPSATNVTDIVWYDNTTGDGDSWAPRTVETGYTGSKSVQAADMDRDGDLDIVAGMYDADKIVWYENVMPAPTPRAVWQQQTYWASDVYDIDEATEDEPFYVIWGSNLPDGLAYTVERGVGATPTYEAISPTITWLPNSEHGVHGSYYFLEPTVAPGQYHYRVSLGSETLIDDEGSQPPLWKGGIAVVTPTATPDPNATPTPRFDFEDPTPVVSSLGNPEVVIAAYLNDDEYIDVVFSDTEDDLVAWSQNDGLLSFRTPYDIDSDAGDVYSMCAVDLNLDASPDLVAALYDSNEIVWYENDLASGTGEWQVHSLTSSATGARGVCVWDLNLDGYDDIIYAASDGNEVAWIPSNGTASFVSSPEVIDSSAPGVLSVCVADLSEDGTPDVVAAHYASNTIKWYENTIGVATGDWTTHTLTSSATGVCYLSANDMDRDGDRDILAVLENTTSATDDNQILWYENDGGAFAQHVVDASAAGLLRAFPVNLDADADIDVLGVRQTGSNEYEVVCYENEVEGATWSCRTLAGGLDGPHFTCAYDLTNDGVFDFMTSSQDSGQIEIAKGNESRSNWVGIAGFEDYGWTYRPYPGFPDDIPNPWGWPKDQLDTNIAHMKELGVKTIRLRVPIWNYEPVRGHPIFKKDEALSFYVPEAKTDANWDVTSTGFHLDSEGASYCNSDNALSDCNFTSCNSDCHLCESNCIEARCQSWGLNNYIRFENTANLGAELSYQAQHAIYVKEFFQAIRDSKLEMELCIDGTPYWLSRKNNFQIPHPFEKKEDWLASMMTGNFLGDSGSTPLSSASGPEPYGGGDVTLPSGGTVNTVNVSTYRGWCQLLANFLGLVDPDRDRKLVINPVSELNSSWCRPNECGDPIESAACAHDDLKEYWNLLKDTKTVLDAYYGYPIEPNIPYKIMVTVAISYEYSEHDLNSAVHVALLLHELIKIAEQEASSFTDVVKVIGLHVFPFDFLNVLPPNIKEKQNPNHWADTMYRLTDKFVHYGGVYHDCCGDWRFRRGPLEVFAGLEFWFDEAAAFRSFAGDGLVPMGVLTGLNSVHPYGMVWQKSALYRMYSRLNMLRQPLPDSSNLTRILWWNMMPIEHTPPAIPDYENSLIKYHFANDRTRFTDDITRPAPIDWTHPVMGKTREVAGIANFHDFFYDTRVNHFPAYYSLCAFSRGLREPRVPIIKSVFTRNASSTSNAEWVVPAIETGDKVDIKVCLLTANIDPWASNYNYEIDDVWGVVRLLIDGIEVATANANHETELVFEDIDFGSLTSSGTRADTILTPSRFHRLSLGLECANFWPWEGTETLSALFPANDFANDPTRFESGNVFITINDPYTLIAGYDFNSDDGGWNFSDEFAEYGDGCLVLYGSNNEGEEDDRDPFSRDHGHLWMALPTTPFRRILVTYDLKVSSLGLPYHGETWTICPGHMGVFGSNLMNAVVDDQLAVEVTSKISAENVSWKQVDLLMRHRLIDYQAGWETRTIDLTYQDLQKDERERAPIDNNPLFGLRFSSQLNYSDGYTKDRIFIDNVKVYGWDRVSRKDLQERPELAELKTIWSISDTAASQEKVVWLDDGGFLNLISGAEVEEGFDSFNEAEDRVLWRVEDASGEKLLLYWNADAGSQNYALALAGEIIVAGYQNSIEPSSCCDNEDLFRIYYERHLYAKLDSEGNLHVLHY